MHLIGIAAVGFLLLFVLGREVFLMLAVAVIVGGIFVVSHAPVLQATPQPEITRKSTPEECNSREPGPMGEKELALFYPGCPPLDKTRACEGPLPHSWNDAAIIKHRRLWNCPIHGSDIGTPGD